MARAAAFYAFMRIVSMLGSGLVAVGLVGGLSSCGEDGPSVASAVTTETTAAARSSPAVTTSSPAAAPTSIASVKQCLLAKGLQVTGGEHTPIEGDTDGPDRGELITRGAFVAFYSSVRRADELADAVRENSQRTGGEVGRYGDVTVVYLQNAKRETIEGCLQR